MIDNNNTEKIFVVHLQNWFKDQINDWNSFTLLSNIHFFKQHLNNGFVGVVYPVKDERWNISLAMHKCSHLDLQGILWMSETLAVFWIDYFIIIFILICM